MIKFLLIPKLINEFDARLNMHVLQLHTSNDHESPSKSIDKSAIERKDRKKPPRNIMQLNVCKSLNCLIFAVYQQTDMDHHAIRSKTKLKTR